MSAVKDDIGRAVERLADDLEKLSRRIRLAAAKADFEKEEDS